MILVTGGAGYIGSIVAEKLRNDIYGVAVVDDLRNGNYDAVDTVLFEDSNFGDELTLDYIFSHYTIDCVIHLAASANVPESFVNPEMYYVNNVMETIKLLRCMFNHEVKNIIFSSTAAVYRDTKYCSEDEDIDPLSPYGKSKLMTEEIITD